MKHLIGCLPAAMLLAFMWASSADAQQTVYRYVGQPFTSVVGAWTPCTTSPACAGGVVPPRQITATLTFNSPLPPNLNWAGVCLPGNPYCPNNGSWSMSDGLHFFNQSSPGCIACSGPLTLSTDANGQITYWAFRVVFSITVGGTEYTEDMEAVYYPPGYFPPGSPRPFVADASAEYYLPGGVYTINGVAQNNTSVDPNAAPGQWKIGPPTPAEAISNLISGLSDPGLGLSSGTISTLTDKLQAALKSIGKGNKTPAVNQLQAFIHQVQSLVNDSLLSAANGALLIAKVNEIITLL
jgi:hypothetical protein